MLGRVIVMPQAAFDKWANASGQRRRPAARTRARRSSRTTAAAAVTRTRRPEQRGRSGPTSISCPQYAEQAKKPLDDFVRESIENPSAYIQPGYPNVMPPFSSLPEEQIDALVAFLTQSSS